MPAAGALHTAASSAPLAPTAPAAPPLSAPAGARALRRRTPGATLDTETPSRPPSSPRPAADQDPDAVRGLVEQFESGVARAMRDISADTDTEEGTSR
jgi:hypothetical protein